MSLKIALYSFLSIDLKSNSDLYSLPDAQISHPRSLTYRESLSALPEIGGPGNDIMIRKE